MITIISLINFLQRFYIYLYLYIYIYIYMLWARRVRHWKVYTHHTDLDEMYLRAQYRWAGHVARLTTWRGPNILTDVLRFRDTKWLARCKAQHGNQGHDKRFRVWRWETAISGYFGPEWHETAYDRKTWEAKIPDAAAWRKHNRFNTYSTEC